MLNIKKIPVSQLRPATYNPRKDLQSTDPDYIKLKGSIEKFGCVEPIIYNEQTGNVVGGHQRLKILIEQGESDIDCVIVFLNEADKMTLNAGLNRIHGEWDMPKLCNTFFSCRLSITVPRYFIILSILLILIFHYSTILPPLVHIFFIHAFGVPLLAPLRGMLYVKKRV